MNTASNRTWLDDLFFGRAITRKPEKATMIRFTLTPSRITTVLAAGLMLLLASTGLFAQEPPPPPSGPPAANSEQFVSIDFNNVEITVFIKFISDLTGKNMVIDPRVKGKVTIVSPSKISIDEAFRVFESVLEVNGFATVDTGTMLKIIPAPDIRTKSIETLLQERDGTGDDRMVTQLIPLRFAEPDAVRQLITPLISKNSAALSYLPTNMLILTDSLSNITRILKIIRAIDVPGVGREITVFSVQNADAAKMTTLLDTIFKTTAPRAGSPPTATDRGVVFVADERTNSVISVASEDDTRRIRSLINTLDQATPKGKEKIQVYYLEYATAEDLVTVLKDLPTGKTATPTGAATGGAKQMPVISENTKITADKATNSLIITASQHDYDTLVDVIRKIDIPRRMVYIEALLMEINAEKSFEIGTEWVVGEDVSLYSGREGIVGGGFTKPEGSAITTDASGNLVPALAPGFSVGLFGESVQIGDVIFPSIGAIVNAYRKDKDVNILSTPQLLATDNQEATITVGKNIPYQTTTSTTNNDTYNSYEYRDVGKTLKITPQISKGRMVRLNLSLEVSSLESTTDFRPTTLKRSVETTVMVKDAGTVVIGGLIDDTISRTDYKVPCLGDIPGLGWLFKTRSTANEKTNLFIFITPKVIENPGEAADIYESKRSRIEMIREKNIKLYRGDSPADTDFPAAIPAPETDAVSLPPPEASRTDSADILSPEAADRYIIQLQSFPDAESAAALAGTLTEKGFPASIVPIQRSEKTWHDVRIGDFQDLETARTVQTALSAMGFTHTFVLKIRP